MSEEEQNYSRWLNQEDRQNDRLQYLLDNPNKIGPNIIRLVSELNDRALGSHGIVKKSQNEKVEKKWQILRQLVEDNKEELDSRGCMLILGGSLLYNDPSENPDYDLVLISMKQNENPWQFTQDLGGQLFERDTELEMADIVFVEWDEFRKFAQIVEAGGNLEENNRFNRMKLHYLNHLLTGFPLHEPEGQNNIAQNLRDHLLVDYYQKIPLLGALAILDLEKVVEHRKNNALKKQS